MVSNGSGSSFTYSNVQTVLINGVPFSIGSFRTIVPAGGGAPVLEIQVPAHELAARLDASTICGPRPSSGYRMPTGSWAGAPISEVPLGHLAWLLNTGDVDRHSSLREECEIQLGLPMGSTKQASQQRIVALTAELERLKIYYDQQQRVSAIEINRLRDRLAIVERQSVDGGRSNWVRAGPSQPAQDSGPFRAVIKRWWRRMSLAFHTDRGGTQEQAVVVNVAYEALEEEIARWEAEQPTP